MASSSNAWQAWTSGAEIPFLDPQEWRADAAGRLMRNPALDEGEAARGAGGSRGAHRQSDASGLPV